MTRHCPALVVSSFSSGQGKTLVTAALARRQLSLGRRVHVFKTGPDFLDPMILERASGCPVHQLDLFMAGEAQCRRLLHQAAGEADLILIEGAMGLFDGSPSSADLAALFGVPVLAVIDASAMAQTFGAVASGLGSHRSNVRVAGAFANRVSGARHIDMLKESLPSSIEWFGNLPPAPHYGLPERHLGLVQGGEIADLDARIDLAAEALGAASERLPAPVAFTPVASPSPTRLLDGVRIAVARDAAFSFLYLANLELLEELGAKLVFFSPLADAVLPQCDALWLPGGYPELHLAPLSRNAAMIAAIREHHTKGKPILAECGGMLYLAESLLDSEGTLADMVGILPARAAMQPNLAALGLQSVHLPVGELRGHTFHYSRLESAPTPWAHAKHPSGRPGEAIFRAGSLVASYVHFYFPSNPSAAARLFLP